jgi:hypothetical protein
VRGVLQQPEAEVRIDGGSVKVPPTYGHTDRLQSDSMPPRKTTCLKPHWLRNLWATHITRLQREGGRNDGGGVSSVGDACQRSKQQFEGWFKESTQ